MNPSDHPLVRVVVLNFDGGQMTIDCLDSLLATDWPSDRLEIVMVDNGSLDDVAERVKAGYPSVRVLEPLANLGFAGGCNLGIELPGDHEFVALVNNDATVHPGWLRPLVEAVRAADDVGAACAKMLFADRFLGAEIEVAPPADGSVPSIREPGLRITAVRVDGVRKDRSIATDEGFFPAPPEPEDPDEEVVRTCRVAGALRVAVEPEQPLPKVISVRINSALTRDVSLRSDHVSTTVTVGPTAQWVDIALGAEPFDVINNVGSNLFAHGYGGDRGFLEIDKGQYETPAEVFAWCGGAVLLRRSYLDSVGVFDERLFLYYEDTDLSWRGRLQGWRYVYEPRSLVRHRHAASSGVGSPVFRFHTERNRLLVLAKNGPWREALRAGLGEMRRFARSAVGAFVIRPLLLQMPERVESAHRRRVALSYLRLLPGMLRDRGAMPLTVTRESLTSWEVTK